MKKFDIPEFYKSSIITELKEIRKELDPRKKDFSPTILDFGPVRFLIARHFGFCYGVENAIEISYRALEENPDKKIYLLSQMIHNPEVNRDLVNRGISFIQDTEGNQITPWDEIKKDNIVIIPAFGTTLEIEKKLNSIGIEVHKYDTTCPFVERVWKKSEKLGMDEYTIIIHGKHNHEETKATFSRSKLNAPSLIIKDYQEAMLLTDIILGNVDAAEFYKVFKGRHTDGFDVARDLQKVGVINQTTMLAQETQHIANTIKEALEKKHGQEKDKNHFADTRDTLCYATNDNQEATYALLKHKADLALVVGGYNSSNTSHIVELCESKLPTYFISSDQEIENDATLNHFDWRGEKRIRTENYLPDHRPLTIILTSGASCPDITIEKVLQKLLSFFDDINEIDDVIAKFKNQSVA
ncbi:MAG: 4-hydroxy-3-methylbut-2-enyl diphosphate reductase [Flavobacteriales bacterium]|nr:4-hydroxy-3-methylbut-2-enyl diphosphate reductase [Flavobacteriales bacterium]